ncbi:Uncharacterized nitroreductase family protein CT0345 [hydrothermal vent metagenome]|uniref:Uncharacterized nitroreductase family protein CT0345 n=1 Tax=hydrothermal vent metagenome TaxID=652676 RepID=A0A3B1CLI2_9ZZZZ
MGLCCDTIIGDMLKNLIEKTRSIRRFKEDKPVEMGQLRDLISYARLSASAANMQPLKYLITNTPGVNAKIFLTLGWAGCLADWPGPIKGERPAAYIIVLGDSSISKNFAIDHGISLQSIRLGATSMGLASCVIVSIKREALSGTLHIADHLEILSVVAIGEPVEIVVLEKMKNGDRKYWRDEDGVHHVPKRSLDEIIIRNGLGSAG